MANVSDSAQQVLTKQIQLINIVFSISLGGSHNSNPHVPGECVVIQLENRCGDGYGEQVNHQNVRKTH